MGSLNISAEMAQKTAQNKSILLLAMVTFHTIGGGNKNMIRKHIHRRYNIYRSVGRERRPKVFEHIRAAESWGAKLPEDWGSFPIAN